MLCQKCDKEAEGQYHYRMCGSTAVRCSYPGTSAPEEITRDPGTKEFHCIRCAFSHKNSDKFRVSIVFIYAFLNSLTADHQTHASQCTMQRPQTIVSFLGASLSVNLFFFCRYRP
jgi:hypothetical protein